MKNNSSVASSIWTMDPDRECIEEVREQSESTTCISPYLIALYALWSCFFLATLSLWFLLNILIPISSFSSLTTSKLPILTYCSFNQESTEELSANLLSHRKISSETLVRLLIDDAIKSFLLFSDERLIKIPCISLNCVLFFKSLKLSDLNCLFSMSLARYQIPFLA